MINDIAGAFSFAPHASVVWFGWLGLGRGLLRAVKCVFSFGLACDRCCLLGGSGATPAAGHGSCKAKKAKKGDGDDTCASCVMVDRPVRVLLYVYVIHCSSTKCYFRFWKQIGLAGGLKGHLKNGLASVDCWVECGRCWW